MPRVTTCPILAGKAPDSEAGPGQLVGIIMGVVEIQGHGLARSKSSMQPHPHQVVGVEGVGRGQCPRFL